MPVNSVARPSSVPGSLSARPVRPGLGHGRAPSMHAAGTAAAPGGGHRFPSTGGRPPIRSISGAHQVASPPSMRSPVMPSSPTGAMRPVHPTARPMPGTQPVRPAIGASVAPAANAPLHGQMPSQPVHAAAPAPNVSAAVSPKAAAGAAAPAPSHRAHPAARRRAYPTAHIAAHSVSYASTPDLAAAAASDAGQDSGVFTPAAVGHSPTRSVSSSMQTPSRTMPMRSVTQPSLSNIANAVPAASTQQPGMAGAVDTGSSIITPGLQGVPDVPGVPGVPGVVPTTGAPDIVQPMQNMSLGPGNARVGNQLLNAVVGAQPPIMTDLEGPPPPIMLPPNATVTPSARANADPSYQRCTLNAIPTTNSLLSKSKLPFAVVLSPMRTVRPEEGDEPVPVVTDSVIARCRRCRTYINPFVTFVDGGQRWKCCMCYITNEVPQLFDWDQETNQPADRWQRPELNSGVVEFIAPREYMVRPPQPPVYVFLVDVTYAAVASGMVSTMASTILASLDAIPNKDNRTKIALIGFDSQLHFFRLMPGSTEPSLLVVSDLDDVFLPQPSDLLVNLSESRDCVETLLRNFGNMQSNAAVTPSALGAALRAAHRLVSATGGKLEVFTSSLATTGPGALKMRDDKKLYGGPRESSLLSAQSSFYKSLSIECSRNQVSVDMWLFGPSYVDVATLSCLPRYTGGQTFFYPIMDPKHPEVSHKFAHELSSVLTSPMSFEAVLRMRATRGIRPTSFHGNFFVRSSDLLALPSVPTDQSYMIECEIDEPLHTTVAVLQSVVLHSTATGERRIRVITTAVPTTTNLSEVYASADQLAIAAFMANKAVEKSLHARLDDARAMIRTRIADIFTAYRTTMTNTRGGNAAHLTIASNLSLLPLLALGLLRNRSIRIGAQIPSDVRAYHQTLLTTLPVQRLIPFLLPVFYSLHNMPPDAGTIDMSTQCLIMPPRLNLSSERFERHGLYLIEDGMSVFLWLGRAAVPALTMDVFGAPDYASLQSGPIVLPELENSMSQRLRAILDRIITLRRGPYLSLLYLVKEDGDPGMRLLALSRLVEDRYEQTSGYLQFLGQIRDKVNGS